MAGVEVSDEWKWARGDLTGAIAASSWNPTPARGQRSAGMPARESASSHHQPGVQGGDDTDF